MLCSVIDFEAQRRFVANFIQLLNQAHAKLTAIDRSGSIRNYAAIFAYYSLDEQSNPNLSLYPKSLSISSIRGLELALQSNSKVE